MPRSVNVAIVVTVVVVVAGTLILNIQWADSTWLAGIGAHEH